MEPKDCRKIKGDRAVIISRTTAVDALELMRNEAGITDNWNNLYADDRSFKLASLRELEEAAKDERT